MVIANSMATNNSFNLNPHGSKQMFIVFHLIFNITLCCSVMKFRGGTKVLCGDFFLTVHTIKCTLRYPIGKFEEETNRSTVN